jgi:uncharacterized membrane protein
MSSRSRVVWFLFTVAVVAGLFSPSYAVAQTEKKDLVIRFSSGSYLDRVEPDKDNPLYLEIENLGNRAITNIRLLADAPEGWLVEFNPVTIDNLAPGSVVPIDVNVKPSRTATKRDNRINFIAEGDGIRRVMTIWLRVENGPSVWLWVGLAIAVAVIAGFVFIFLRIGRQ